MLGDKERADTTLFGVSEANQIKDKMARELAEYSGTLIKSYSDKEENGNRYQPALEDLRNSDAIVVFGVSFGVSDKLWWRELASQIMNRDNLRIYIFPYNSRPSSIETVEDRSGLRYEWRRKLFSSVRNDFNDKEFTRLQENMHKVIILPFGPYEKHGGSSTYGDPWDLSYFSKKVLNSITP